MFNKGLVHRDLKDENIVVNENYDIKVIDFGSAARIPMSKESYFTKFRGTTLSGSPEVLRGDAFRGPEADIWYFYTIFIHRALGVMMFTIATGDIPFFTKDEAIKGVFEFPEGNRLSEGCKGLIRDMLCVDIEKRIAVDGVLSSRYDSFLSLL
jgi:protein-serine/threonine kinase